MRCRFCDAQLSHVFADLDNAPLSNSYLTEDQLKEPEISYPLKVFFCEQCWLVQTDDHKKSEEIFNSEYAYFSSFSSSWLKHSQDFVTMITEKLHLQKSSLVVEIASNDGYLLQFFQGKNIPCFGIEPTASTAKAARDKGVETIQAFFTAIFANQLVCQGQKADLIIGNNVLAHVPDLNDFVEGLRLLLAEEGTITMEFPHLMNLIKYNQFDTIYHEHFSYLSFQTVYKIFKMHNLTIYDVAELPTHGGSLRVFARHSKNKNLPVSESVKNLLGKEQMFGLFSQETYMQFQGKIGKVRDDFLKFLWDAKANGKIVAGYGAAAKGNTLLNYCGVKKNLIDFVADASPYKRGKYLPGSHIPVVSEQKIKEEKPDYVILFPWNIQEELVTQLGYVRNWNGKFVTVIPALEIF
ncbi:MAG: class I SAM-dependent methyltransferase [Desulfobacula sp.]|nr:class I SAM-dependent methyltransferase [Desulfobacula sp.]